ncbi:MAG: HEAT repeat domain-containing protein [Deltaproteobacteria bacterium]|nr:HEAT repeat domain-containing protein [Deltaproteobacteria bacterium]MBI3386735.1 HEAT repeat domain-containing protein [Deltaproteobacteria bacterium]
MTIVSITGGVWLLRGQSTSPTPPLADLHVAGTSPSKQLLTADHPRPLDLPANHNAAMAHGAADAHERPAPATHELRLLPPAPDAVEADPELQALDQIASSDPDPIERAAALSRLHTVTTRSVLPLLVRAFADADAEVRRTALEEIAWSDEEDMIRAAQLAGVMTDPDPDVRIAALRILGEIEDPDAEPMIRDALADPDDDVQALAADLLDNDS